MPPLYACIPHSVGLDTHVLDGWMPAIETNCKHHPQRRNEMSLWWDRNGLTIVVTTITSPPPPSPPKNVCLVAQTWNNVGPYMFSFFILKVMDCWCSAPGKLARYSHHEPCCRGHPVQLKWHDLLVSPPPPLPSPPPKSHFTPGSQIKEIIV